MGTSKKPPLSLPSGSGSYRSTSAASSTSATRTAGPTSATSTSTTISAPSSVTTSAVTPATPIGVLPHSNSHSTSASSSTSPTVTARRRPSESMSAGSAKPRSISEESEESKRRSRDLSQLILIVCQQPERARLCSYKEENDTVDRRPVDPPPVVELASKAGTFPEVLDSTAFFIRASLVAAEASPPNAPEAANGEKYAPIKTPTGAEPTSGEVIQTPERLKHLDGTPGALCIFPKLSVRLPGIFRLKFTLFETGQDGISEITHVVSAPFEVFSPKLFKGMHESTPLTRHLANQGLKVKLRTDPNGGKGASRRRASVASSNAAPGRAEPESPATRGAAGVQPPHLLYAPMAAGPASAPPYGHPTRNLVWHHQYHQQGYLSERERSPAQDAPRKRARTNDWRDGRDDRLFELNHISSKLDLSAPSPSSDLSAFSLGHAGRPTSAPSPPGFRWAPRDHGADDGFPAFPMPSSAASIPRRPFSEARPAPPPPHEPPYARDRRDYGRETEPSKESPRTSPHERHMSDGRMTRERELARERDIARERELAARDRERWDHQRDPRDRRGGAHGHHPHSVHVYPQGQHGYSNSRSYSPPGPPPAPHGPHGGHGMSEPSFALPRLPPIVPGDPMDPRASHVHGGHPYPPPPHGHHPSHHQPHSAHSSPQTPQGHSVHPPYPPHPAQSAPPPSSSSGPAPHNSHGSSNHHVGSQASPPPLLPPIREHSPVHARGHPPYERDLRR